MFSANPIEERHYISSIYMLHQRLPIMDPVVLAAMVRYSGQNAHGNVIDWRIRYFPNWNLSWLNLEKLDDSECIDAMNETYFKLLQEWRDQSSEITFMQAFRRMQQWGGNYGIEGLHSGLREFLANLFLKDCYRTESGPATLKV